MVTRLKWAALVVGCAAPVAAAMWSNLDTQGHIGVAAGVVGWIIAIAPIERAIQRRESAETSRDLMLGATALLAIEAIGSLTLPQEALLAFFWPAVMTGAMLNLVPDSGSDFIPAFVLTALCGGQAFICAYLLGKAGRTVRHRLGPSVRAEALHEAIAAECPLPNSRVPSSACQRGGTICRPAGRN